MAEKMTPAAGHNSEVTKGDFLAHLRLVSGARRALDEANGLYRSTLKAAKKDGVNQKQLIKAMDARKLDPDEVAKDYRDFLKYMSWMGLPVGTQTSLFGDAKPDDGDDMSPLQDHEHKMFLASDAGYEAGRKGGKRDTNPHPDGSEYNQEWDREWIRGQSSIAAEMGPGISNVAAPKRGGGRPGRKPKEPPEPIVKPLQAAGDAPDDKGDDKETVH